ncbi:hypothetical protein LTR70_010634 [Exophiala xenobiotica]|nr:hypothetical protein LTR70_010634 [Exophiala xenobiotica]
MTARRQGESPQHILLLGASGVSGLAFVTEHLSIPATDPAKPFLTLYIRASSRSKFTSALPSATTTDIQASKIRIIEGELTDESAVRTAFSANGVFPKVTAVISVLGAYMSLYHFLTRTKPTPIADALKSIVVPTMRAMGVKRILVLSTPSFQVPGENKQMSWGWYLNGMLPVVVLPQGNAEMKGIAHAVMDNSLAKLEQREGELEVRAFVLGGTGNTENKTLSRRSMVRWLLKELDEKEWIGKSPMLCNLVAQ